ncbi:DUF1360 domain-containing protein [Streptacidiphilus jiangxiensis]|uniref:DUF1360 domain-containing protein n=1 Tax=Streptacidiphilus jiangxiensis TaxID=235985 RepID=A0A1H7HA99_STRJI|nr:DUF1360 domain-containing protein [Streptacidiphilus jiangxiensis]SEK45025.1 Protein of unknown function [Streptacidiphilus jiangxiensis]
MNPVSDVLDRLRQRLQREASAYAPDDERPLAAYVGAMGVYAAGVISIGAVARWTRRPLPEPTPWDVTLTALATHQLGRLLAKDPVTSPLRAPFTRFEGTSGPAELAEEVRGQGARKAVGELVTCPFCTGLWVTTGFTAGSVFVPRATRLAAATFASLALADLLQFGRVRAQHAAEEGT